MIVDGLKVGSVAELLRRAAAWEREATSGFKPDRSESCMRQAKILFEQAMIAEQHERDGATNLATRIPGENDLPTPET